MNDNMVVKKKKLYKIFSESKTYKIPQYQREYIWGKREWENLYDDLDNNDENFIGTIILVDKNKSMSEVIDGQQRLTTISILFIAIHEALSRKCRGIKTQIKKSLTNQENSEPTPKLVLQFQGSNKDDYEYLLSECKFIERKKYPNYFGNRRLSRAYTYFRDRLVEEDQKNIIALYHKLREAVFVEISVGTKKDAYMMFEALNNRGVPLTAVDLIKNTLISKSEEEKGSKGVDDAYNRWVDILEQLGEDYSVQERFLRQYYNAYRENIRAENQNDKFPDLATRTTLIEIYEKLINNDYEKLLDDLYASAKNYHKFVMDDDNDSTTDNRQEIYRDLDHVQAAPALMLMLYLENEREKLKLKDNDIKRIVNNIVSFFVRRNVTGLPLTSKLPRLFMNIIISLDGKKSEEVCDIITNRLKETIGDDEMFEDRLSGNMYLDSTDMTRFILCKIEESSHTDETKFDLWKKVKTGSTERYAMTIEHIFPKGDNIPDPWIKMITGSSQVDEASKTKAEKYREDYAHKLGNLTLTKYNSKLSNKPFEDKKSQMDRDNNKIGYENNLYLNRDIVNKEKWTTSDIDERTTWLVEQVKKIFVFK